jgi:hypothetical protein
MLNLMDLLTCNVAIDVLPTTILHFAKCCHLKATVLISFNIVTKYFNTSSLLRIEKSFIPDPSLCFYKKLFYISSDRNH